MRGQAVMFAVTWIGAALAIPLLYKHRSPELFVTSVIAFGVLPFLAAVFQSGPLRAPTCAAAMLLIMCPVAYLVTDRLDQEFEKLRDTLFLVTGSTAIFATAGWQVAFARRRNWLGVVVAGLALLAALASVCVLLGLIVFLE